jgi:hypothetical protein
MYIPKGKGVKEKNPQIYLCMDLSFLPTINLSLKQNKT